VVVALSATEQEPADQQDGQKELSFNERVALDVLAIFAQREMIVDGGVDMYAVADEIQPTIFDAKVKAEGDRSKVGVTPTHLMETHFPEVPRRDSVDSTDVDLLDYTDAVYAKVKDQVFRVLNIMPDGIIQGRLAALGDGWVLCRMKGKRGAEEVAYISRNRKCIDADNNGPAYHRVHLAIARAAALTGMSIERVPEHGIWFQRQHKRSLKNSLEAGDNVVIAALDSGDEPDDGPGGDDDE
jgi:hypothetical protein